LKAAEEKTAGALDAVNPDLTAFKARGGKLILYNGWNDAVISPLATIDYYNSVAEKVGAPADRRICAPVPGSGNAALRGRAGADGFLAVGPHLICARRCGAQYYRRA